MKKILLLAALWPLVFVWFAQVAANLLRQRHPAAHFDSELVPNLMQTVIAALPFIALYLFARRHAGEPGARTGLIAAGMLMAAASFLLWGWLFLDAVAPPGGGANIGLGILLLLSPGYLPLLLPLGYRLGRRLAGG